MNVVARKERGLTAAGWVRAGQRQAPDMGGEELLSCRFFVREGVFVDAGIGLLDTQVRAGEDPEILEVLLDKLLDRFDSFLPDIGSKEAQAAFREKLRWFGPEMAEEY